MNRIQEIHKVVGGELNKHPGYIHGMPILGKWQLKYKNISVIEIQAYYFGSIKFIIETLDKEGKIERFNNVKDCIKYLNNK